MVEALLSLSTGLSSRNAPSSAPPLSRSGRSSEYQPILEEIQNLLEALATGVGSRAAKKLEKRHTMAMGLYFRRLAKKFPYSNLTGYVSQYQAKESLSLLVNLSLVEAKKDSARKLTGKGIEASSDDLLITLKNGSTAGYELGGKQAADAIRIIPTFDLVDPGAQKWIRKRAALQVTNINKVTRDRLARVLIDGVDKGLPVPKIARNIRAEINEMSRYRSNLIAQNELNESMSESSLRTFERLGVSGKSWSTVGDDRVSEDCQSNAASGIIPIDANFATGKDRPPQHPNCRCTLTPERKR